ncbi:MAG TPA: hypothetical protein VIU64_15075, partial [Polyangia bacterium]
MSAPPSRRVVSTFRSRWAITPALLLALPLPRGTARAQGAPVDPRRPAALGAPPSDDPAVALSVAATSA